MHLKPKFTVRNILVKNMTADEVAACKTLAFPGDMGCIKDELDGCLQRPMSGSRAAMVIERDTNQIVSWGLASRLHGESSKPAGQFFTHPDYRRMGLGSLAYQSLAAKMGDMKTYPHDPASFNFFRTNKGKAINVA